MTIRRGSSPIYAPARWPPPAATNAVLDTRTGALSCETGVLFTGVDVGPGASGGGAQIAQLTAVPQAELVAVAA